MLGLTKDGLLEWAQEYAGHEGTTFSFREISESLEKIGVCPIYVDERYFIEPWH